MRTEAEVRHVSNVIQEGLARDRAECQASSSPAGAIDPRLDEAMVKSVPSSDEDEKERVQK